MGTKRLDFSADNKAAVYEHMISERDKIAATYPAEGQAEAAHITAEGEAEYMRILAEIYIMPERARFYSLTRALESAKASLAGKPTH